MIPESMKKDCSLDYQHQYQYNFSKTWMRECDTRKENNPYQLRIDHSAKNHVVGWEI